jgi:hypothetical protein
MSVVSFYNKFKIMYSYMDCFPRNSDTYQHSIVNQAPSFLRPEMAYLGIGIG